MVAIEPSTGAVLAFVSKPGFDPNLFVDGIDSASWAELNNSPDRPLNNRALTGVYPPGSTFKPYMALAALTYGKRRPEQTIFDAGGYQFGNHYFRDDKKGGHGSVDMYKSIVVSCDTYYYVLANDMGIDAIARFMGSIGLGQRIRARQQHMVADRHEGCAGALQVAVPLVLEHQRRTVVDQPRAAEVPPLRAVEDIFEARLCRLRGFHRRASERLRQKHNVRMVALRFRDEPPPEGLRHLIRGVAAKTLDAEADQVFHDFGQILEQPFLVRRVLVHVLHLGHEALVGRVRGERLDVREVDVGGDDAVVGVAADLAALVNLDAAAIGGVGDVGLDTVAEAAVGIDFARVWAGDDADQDVALDVRRYNTVTRTTGDVDVASAINGDVGAENVAAARVDAVTVEGVAASIDRGLVDHRGEEGRVRANAVAVGRGDRGGVLDIRTGDGPPALAAGQDADRLLRVGRRDVDGCLVVDKDAGLVARSDNADRTVRVARIEHPVAGGDGDAARAGRDLDRTGRRSRRDQARHIVASPASTRRDQVNFPK